MLMAFKYKLLPNDSQKTQLMKTFGCTRKVYNFLVKWNMSQYELWKANGKQKGNSPKIPLVTDIKKEFPYLNEVDSLALMNARANFESAMKNFYQSCAGKRKKKTKLPRFKKKNASKESYSTNNQSSTIKITGNSSIKLPKIKTPIKLIYHRELQGSIKQCTVSMEKDGTFHVSILCEVERQSPPKRKINKVIGLDMSLAHTFVSSEPSENDHSGYERLYRKNEKKLKRLNKRHSRKETFKTGETYFSKKWNKDVFVKRPSNNREKARERLAKLHAKISNKRLDFIKQSASRLTKTYDCIVIETLNMQGMSRSLKFGKSVHDIGWGLFVKWLEWDCEKNGCTLVKADKWYASSKLCNYCGGKNEGLKLSDREWVCPCCGSLLDRDFNAALNLRDYYERYCTAGTAGIDACGDSTSTVREFSLPTASTVVESRNPLPLGKA